MKAYLGVDVGSISTNLAIIDVSGYVIKSVYLRTAGDPVDALKRSMKQISEDLPPGLTIHGVGTTGSARRLAGVILNADLVKNEITAHAVAATYFVPGVQTVIEMGGQDSKIIILRDGMVVDFAINTVCSAGTGSFLDLQAMRLQIPIEQFGELALKSKRKVRISGRCSVFAESDMIHKSQLGIPKEDIVNALCEAIVRNYLNDVGCGKKILPPVVFQGGVAANYGVKRAFESALGMEIIVPEYYNVMGAIGAAILVKESIGARKTGFVGFKILDTPVETRGFDCEGCANNCEVIEILIAGKIIDRFGDRCGKWEVL